MATIEERQRILDEVVGMESFHRHMSIPKLQNWFAWNRCCHDQLKEFDGAKEFFYSIMGNPVTPLDPCNQPPCRPGAGRKKQRSFSYQATDWFSIYI